MNAGAALSPPFHWQSSAPAPDCRTTAGGEAQNRPRSQELRGVRQIQGQGKLPAPECRPSPREQPMERQASYGLIQTVTCPEADSAEPDMPSLRTGRRQERPMRPVRHRSRRTAALGGQRPKMRRRRQNGASTKEKPPVRRQCYSKSKKHIKKNWLIISSRRCEQIS